MLTDLCHLLNPQKRLRVLVRLSVYVCVCLSLSGLQMGAKGQTSQGRLSYPRVQKTWPWGKMGEKWKSGKLAIEVAMGPKR